MLRHFSVQQMAGIYCYTPACSYLQLQSKKRNGFRCSSGAPDNKKQTPQFLKIAVSGITELLRLFSTTNNKLDIVRDKKRNESSVSTVDEVLMVLRSDYEKAYFVTGIFTSSLYADDCIFEDPTIKFRGKELYERNLKLLVPFFDRPSIGLQTIEKGASSETIFLLATWKLRTYLKLPWRPLVRIAGSTIYDLDEEFKITRHAESWNVSALEAIGQIFTPGFGTPDN